MKFYIIWPERRFVSEETIAMWFSDALANEEIDAELARVTDPEMMARELHYAGLITLGRRS